MNDTPLTIRQLLEIAEAGQPYASAAYTDVYEIPGFPGYLLRDAHRRFRNFKTRLKDTSALTPVFLCERNFGQPVLDSGESFQIVRKVEGTTLLALYQQDYDAAITAGLSDNNANLSAQKTILKRLLELPDESFEGLVDQLRYLTEHVIAADPHYGNIVLDDQKMLHYIDVRAQEADKKYFFNGNCLRVAMAYLGRHPQNGTCDDHINANPDIMTLREQLDEKVIRAAKKVGYNRTFFDLQNEFNQKQLSITTAKPIDTQLGVLSLDAPAHELGAMLRRTRDYSPHTNR